MDQSLILRSQKNEVLELVKISRLDPFNFKWARCVSRKTHDLIMSRLNYHDTEFFFEFDFDHKSHWATFSPGVDQVINSTNTVGWKAQLHAVEVWLVCLMREVNEPDLWEQMSRYQLPSGDRPSPEATNDPFTAQQVERIAEAVNKVRGYLESEVRLEAEQRHFVNEHLDYLVDAAKRQGKRDWFHTCIGVIITISTGLALAPEKSRAIWGIIRESITGVIQLLTQ